MLDIFGQRNPRMLPSFIHGERWLREIRISKSADGYRHVFFSTGDTVMHCCSANRAKVKSDRTSRITDSHVRRGSTFDLDALPAKSCLCSKHASSSSLTRETVANRNSNWFTGRHYGKLAASAGCGACDLGWPHLTPNDRVERPATMTVPRPDAAHNAPRSARTRC
jgi:hypothetical protein